MKESELLSDKKIKEDQNRIFGELFRKFGNSPMATSSESPEHKRLRYAEILNSIEAAPGISIHDVGMGLSQFHDFVAESLDIDSFEYSGSEILEDYVHASRRRLPERTFFHRNLADSLSEQATAESYDFVVLSGVFHQMQNTPIPEWEKYLKSLLRNSFSLATKGIVFNLVSPYVEFQQSGIYYAKLHKILDFIVEDLSRFFIVRHNYALYEFTVAVYTEEYTKSRFHEPVLQKYFG